MKYLESAEVQEHRRLNRCDYNPLLLEIGYRYRVLVNCGSKKPIYDLAGLMEAPVDEIAGYIQELLENKIFLKPQKGEFGCKISSRGRKYFQKEGFKIY